MSYPAHKDSDAKISFRGKRVEDRKIDSLIQRVRWKIEGAISWL